MQVRSTLSPDVVCWASDARVTGSEDALTLVQRIQTVSSEIWRVLASLHREETESEELFNHRKAQIWTQFAPILDRIGRLTADSASVLRCIAGGGEILAVPPAGGSGIAGK